MRRFLTGGIKIGDVVRLTAGTFNALNLNKNLLVLGVTLQLLSRRRRLSSTALA